MRVFLTLIPVLGHITLRVMAPAPPQLQAQGSPPPWSPLGTSLYLQDQEAEKNDEEQPSDNRKVWQEIHRVSQPALRARSSCEAAALVYEFFFFLAFSCSHTHVTRRRSCLVCSVAQTLTLGQVSPWIGMSARYTVPRVLRLEIAERRVFTREKDCYGHQLP